jgi:hypothetical protein
MWQKQQQQLNCLFYVCCVPWSCYKTTFFPWDNIVETLYLTPNLWPLPYVLQCMASGRSGHHGACVRLRVGVATALGTGCVPRPNMEGEPVTGLRPRANSATSPSAQVWTVISVCVCVCIFTYSNETMVIITRNQTEANRTQQGGTYLNLSNRNSSFLCNCLLLFALMITPHEALLLCLLVYFSNV